MKKAIIIHGISRSKEFVAEHFMPVTTWHWQAWLQQLYNLAGVNCQNPLFPNSWFPDKNYHDDEEAFSNFKIDEDTRLVAWSCGCAFIFKYLYLHPEIKAKHLVLIAPFFDKENQLNYFSNEFDPNLMNRFNRIDLFYSTDDPHSEVIDWAKKLIIMYPNINVHKFEHYGHFNEEKIGTKEFPELWEVCKQEI